MFDHKTFLSSLPSRPGVYCMRDKAQKVLYIGKAKDLKKRLSSYFRPLEDPRIKQLVGKITTIDVTVTQSEKEALLLEISLIKSLKPHYNVIFRDDKSFPYLFVSKHDYPRLIYIRGKQKEEGTYYGPYPSALAVKDTLTTLQKLFKLRQCDDTFFKHRQRPCLQYQIQRCSAPCTKYISKEDYATDVEDAKLFLNGKQSAILDNLVKKMDDASTSLDFERASEYRDQIISLRAVFDQQVIYQQKGNADVIAAVSYHEHACIHLLMVRQGQIVDSQTFFPKNAGEGDLAVMLRGFITQFYFDRDKGVGFPNSIIVNQAIEDEDAIEQMLTERFAHKVEILQPRQGTKVKWLQLAEENATQALMRKQSALSSAQGRWIDLKKVLGLKEELTRIECFDVSHTQGEATMASCVVFDANGPVKAEYRRYALEVNPGDDYAAMSAVLTRRYMNRKVENLPLPEIVMVDGGKGQLHVAKKALLECQLVEVLIIAIAKGEGRKPGLETLHLTRLQSDDEWVIKLPPFSKAFHLLQFLRDESHRYALAGHRRKRNQARKKSILEEISGIGPKRRQALLNNFGGLQGLQAASIESLSKVPGISLELATTIYAALHGELKK